jgi:hypothetical protein
MTEEADAELQPLYIRLYFDEDVSAEIVENLRRRGFDVSCARDSALLSRDDDAQLAFAVSQQRALVTHNRHDFEARHRRYVETGRRHFGIIVARRRPKPARVVQRLLALLDRMTAEGIQDQLQYI